ncbi:MAG: hypothetical protein A3F43_01305 [Gammaproteobacteria bacterium RIFCSPHIGHO2_12_FULL_42_10]|nr:MAG: hypothetical protein A3F43_01305 [Gammaproteobacteria bacterium RIFCSPHIGHO2_12_FULL_42_10]
MEDFNRHCLFTQFTSDLLAHPELNQSIYHLQHDSGFNINIILYFLWLAKSRYGRLSKRNLKDLEAQVMLWHRRVIAELKYTYALLTGHTDSISVKIKHLLEEEIAKAHMIEQCMMYESKIKTKVLRRTPQQQLMDGCASMLYYCELKNDLLIEEDKAAFNQLFYFVFDTFSRAEVEQEITLAFNQLKVNPGISVQLMWEAF